MDFYRVSSGRINILPIRLMYYPDLRTLVGGSFYFNMNTLSTAGLHILTYGVNNLTLVVL